jgi:flagellin-like hook-associated protein FlgL
MSSIALSGGVRNALTSLQSTAQQAQIQQTRLATGKKVNSALDNPSNFFTAASLTSRSNDLTNLLDGLGQAVKTIEAADKGIKALTKLVESAQSVARQALQAGSNAQGQTTGTVNVTRSTAVTTGGTLTLQNAGGPAVDFTIADGETIGSVIDKINGGNAGFKAELVDVGANKRLKISSNQGKDLTISGDAITTGTIDTEAGISAATFNASASAGAERAALAQQFDDLRTQINELAKDTGYNGKNLLNGDSLEVVFNEKSGSAKSKLDITGVTFDSAGLGIAASTGNFATEGDISTAQDNLTGALTKLRTQASKFGSNLSTVQTRQDFTNGLIGTLEAGSDQLVVADTNAEAAKLLALNTRQQLSSTALSLASQADQGVLRLF